MTTYPLLCVMLLVFALANCDTDTTKLKDKNSFYQISEETASWQDGHALCKDEITDEAAMVRIDTKKQFDYIYQFLHEFGQDDTLPDYVWTSGMYDTSKNAFVWENGAEFDTEFLTWSPDHPESPASDETRVVMNVKEGTLETRDASFSAKHLCELKL